MWSFGNRDRQTPAKAPRRLNPSDAVLKHLGKDIVKKSQRRKKYLFSFPGHIAPIGHGGWIGDLKNLGTKNPVLYVDFPQSKLLFPKEDMQEVTVEPEPNTGGMSALISNSLIYFYQLLTGNMLSGSIPDSILKAGSNVGGPSKCDLGVLRSNAGIQAYVHVVNGYCLYWKFLEKSIEVPIWFTYDFLPHEKANVNQLCTGASLLGANKTIEATLSAFTFGLPVSEAEDQVH
ncbi:hypothetical protein K1719_027333 [Acacia pycnantha]|nr:hypothetical protein K1719_027333 [Acacia pycnantha]